MTTAASIIQSAYRESNIIPAGKQPTTDEQTEALALLNSLLLDVMGFELGEPLADWLFPQPQRTASVAANYPQLPLPEYVNPLQNTYFSPYPPNNSRVIWGETEGTVWFPEKPNAGSQMALLQGSGAGDGGTSGVVLTLDGNGRLIQDPADSSFKTQVTFTSPLSTTYSWFYRDDLGQWLLLKTLALTDSIPFPPEHDTFWICRMAVRLNPRYNKTTTNETTMALKIATAKLKARYRQDPPTVYGSENFPRTAQDYIVGSGWWL